MATGQDGKTFKQDMVVSIRYRNDLPPPPMPPKLLEIDHEGISQYLTTGFASGIARREQPNIDVDAEGGMAIDMIGIPGYFQGDESAIMAPEMPPILEQADLNLLLTPEQLKNEAAMNAGHSFLRKTQYMNAANARAGNDPFMGAQRQKKQPEKTSSAPVARDDPENIKQNIQKGFDLAYPDSMTYDTHKGESITSQERNAWSNPKHPTNPNLKPVSFHPVLPDFNATTDGGFNWNYVKFAKPPLPAYHDKRDPRIDAAFVMAIPNDKEIASYRARKEAYDQDPQNYDDPGPEPNVWPLYIPTDNNSSTAAVNKIRRVFNEGEPDKTIVDDISDLTTSTSNDDQRIQFDRARIYGSVKQEYPDPRRFMGLSLFDPKTAAPGSRHRKQGPAAYYYPIWEKDLFRSERGKIAGSNRAGGGSGPRLDEEYGSTIIPDHVMLFPHEDEAIPQRTQYVRASWRGNYDYTFRDEFKVLEKAAIAEQDREEKNAGVTSSAKDENENENENGNEDEVEVRDGINHDDIEMDNASRVNGVNPHTNPRPDHEGDSDLMEDD